MSASSTGGHPVLVPLADGGGGCRIGTGKELSHSPSDGVSSLSFSRHSDHLLVSSWDKTVRLYDAEANVPMGVFMHAGAVLDCCFHDDSSGFSAGGNNTVRRRRRRSIIRYAFKCRRLTEDGRDIVYPVNAISFHPIRRYGTFATGGCDRFVNVWDGANKRRLFQYPRYPCSIAALSFSRDGSLLAVASSYSYEEGDIPHESDAIFICDVNEVEVKPRPRHFLLRHSSVANVQ